MYRQDRLAYLHRLKKLAEQQGFVAGVKLVRGAYLEKEAKRAKKLGYLNPIHPDKAATDKAFDAALRLIVSNIDHFHLCAASHNTASNDLLTSLMIDQGIERSSPRITFSQLLGMSDDISHQLAAEGFKVSKYVPFGPLEKALPYLVRRAQENSSVGGQAGRELSILAEELRYRCQARFPKFFKAAIQ